MKYILGVIIGFCTFGILSSEAICQESRTERNYDFKVGDVLSSLTGTLTGDLRRATVDDDNVVGVFMGMNSNLRSDVVRSEGVVEVNVSDMNGVVRKGDLLTVVENGMVGKLLKSGVTLGVAFSDPSNGKVRVKLDISYSKVK